jgi:hypothetical protein
MFRGKLLAFLMQSYRHNELCFSGTLAALSQPPAFYCLLHTLRRREWVVYSKPPSGGAETRPEVSGPLHPTVSPSPTEGCSASTTAKCAFAGQIPDTTTAAAS